MQNKFDPEKAIEAILYIAPKVGGDMYKTLKMLYLAEKSHLENYGSFILGDWFSAMDYGPVASNCYDICKYVRGDETNKDYDAGVPQAKEAFQMKRNNIITSREPNLDLLSKADLDSLNEVIERYGHLNFTELRELTHDDAYHAAGQNKQMDIRAIAATLPNGAEINQYLSELYPD